MRINAGDEEIMILRSHSKIVGLGLSQQLYPLQSQKERGTAGIGMGARGRNRVSRATGHTVDTGEDS